MKILEIPKEKFNDLISAEPDANIYQTTNWADYYKTMKYEPLYIGYVNDKNVYSAFAAILIKKGSIFKPKVAICHGGFLINFYDNELLQSFDRDLKKYLSKKRIKSLTIIPNIKYQTSRGNNDLLISQLHDLGYEKVDSEIQYLVDANNVHSEDNNVFDVYVAENDEQYNCIFQLDKKYKHIFDNLQEHVKFVVCKLNNDGRKPIVAISCITIYKNTIIQLFTDKKMNCLYDYTETINNKICEITKELGCISYISYLSNAQSQKVELIGAFRTKI